MRALTRAPRRRMFTPILCYHRVVPVLPRDPLGIIDRYRLRVETRIFQTQMRFLARHFKVVPLAELVEQVERGDVRSGQVVVTFDDGHVDNHRFAFPILKQLGLPWTVFVSTSFIETGRPFWWDRLAAIVSSGVGRIVDAPLDSGRSLRIDLMTPRGVKQSFDELRRSLSGLEGPRRHEALEALASELGSLEVTDDDRPMTWAEVRTLAAAGVTIGAHTHSHPDLRKLPSDLVRMEVGHSRELIRERLGLEPAYFAYPYGDFDEQAVEVVSRAGFRAAVTVEEVVCTAESSRFLLPRITVPNCSQAGFRRGFEQLSVLGFAPQGMISFWYPYRLPQRGSRLGRLFLRAKRTVRASLSRL
jgi:peptidoglycan/xylan/chitin deacetylase (PgdA/CDA1 family)